MAFVGRCSEFPDSSSGLNPPSLVCTASVKINLRRGRKHRSKV